MKVKGGYKSGRNNESCLKVKVKAFEIKRDKSIIAYTVREVRVSESTWEKGRRSLSSCDKRNTRKFVSTETKEGPRSCKNNIWVSANITDEIPQNPQINAQRNSQLNVEYLRVKVYTSLTRWGRCKWEYRKSVKVKKKGCIKKAPKASIGGKVCKI